MLCMTTQDGALHAAAEHPYLLVMPALPVLRVLLASVLFLMDSHVKAWVQGAVLWKVARLVSQVAENVLQVAENAQVSVAETDDFYHAPATNCTHLLQDLPRLPADVSVALPRAAVLPDGNCCFAG